MKSKLILTIALLATPIWAFPLNAAETGEPNGDPQIILLTQTDWQSFSFDVGKFSIEIPVVPKVVKDFTEIDGEKLDWNLFRADDDFYWNSFKAEDEPADLYVVGYTDLSAEYVRQGDETVLDKMSNGLLRELELQELGDKSQKISLDGHPGREFLNTQEEKIVAMRLYLVGQRLYGLFAVSEDITKIERFFSSFELQ
jgi:hypothetical protein